jgi:flap endonuclease-1
MGVKGWKNVIPWRWADLSELYVHKIAIDAPNYMMRRSTAIPTRQSDRISMTHIRIALGTIRQALKRHLLPVFIFDGPPESLKRAPNPQLITAAQMFYERFLLKQDVYDRKIADSLQENPAVRMYFAANHIKDLCRAIGIPAITAPSEAEMYGAVLCRDGLVGTLVSNDADALLFGSPHVTKSLQLSKGQIECATLSELERTLNLDLELLRDLAIVCGCDFHKKGVKGLGPRKGVIELQKHGGLAYLLRARGLTPSEREEYILAREVFDEPTYMSTKGVDLTLKPPVVTRLNRILRPALGKEKAESKTREMVSLWKKFGKEQSTLESYVL